MKITKVIAFQILDSRGRPTIATRLTLDDGSHHLARVPSGASTGAHEALELRDKGTRHAEGFYRGASVFSAVENVNNVIAPKLIGFTPSVATIDELLNELDPTANHEKLGANAKLSVSLANLKAVAHSGNLSIARYFAGSANLLLPMPMVNILSGGAHANRSLDIQDVLVIPNGAKSFSEALSWIVSVRERAAENAQRLGKVSHLVADEGGLGLHFSSIAEACDFVTSSIHDVGLRPGADMSIALDFASTQYFQDGEYHLQTEGRSLAPSEYITYISSLLANQPIISIEDPFAEDDWVSWQEFSAITPRGIQLLGDDLFTTNFDRLKRGIETKAANSILIKVNQNGLVSGTQEVLEHARANLFRTVVSARSGETEDSWLADLAVGWQAEQIKVGSTHGSERNAKWNRLIELEATEATTFANPFSTSVGSI